MVYHGLYDSVCVYMIVDVVSWAANPSAGGQARNPTQPHRDPGVTRERAPLVQDQDTQAEQHVHEPVFSGFRWFQMVSDGFRWFQMVSEWC